MSINHQKDTMNTNRPIPAIARATRPAAIAALIEVWQRYHKTTLPNWLQADADQRWIVANYEQLINADKEDSQP